MKTGITNPKAGQISGVSKGIRVEWILAGFLIAIISLPVGLVLPLPYIFSILVMFIILSISYIDLRKGSAILL